MFGVQISLTKNKAIQKILSLTDVKKSLSLYSRCNDMLERGIVAYEFFLHSVKSRNKPEQR